MAKYARGKHAVFIDDRTGFKKPYKNARTEWTGMRVDKSEFTPKHPQLEPQKYIKSARGNVLFKPRTDNDLAGQTTTVRLGPLHGKASLAVGAFLRPPQISVTEEAQGLAMSALHGANEVIIPQTVSVTGVGATSAIGTVIIDLTEQAEGLEATAVQGTVKIGGQENAEGLAATAQQGTVIIPVIVDPNMTAISWGEDLYGAFPYTRDEVTTTAQQGTVVPMISAVVSQEGTSAILGDGTQYGGVILNFAVPLGENNRTPAGVSWGENAWGDIGFSKDQINANIGEVQIGIGAPAPGVGGWGEQAYGDGVWAADPDTLTMTAQQGIITVVIDESAYGQNLYGKGDWGD
jgi:hypothetical protein|tara:strand:- start:7294 stop:8337 length:1044 start_codon:yes stop_codon:yes gene_type:complete